jgi:hypothetical protein
MYQSREPAFDLWQDESNCRLQTFQVRNLQHCGQNPVVVEPAMTEPAPANDEAIVGANHGGANENPAAASQEKKSFEAHKSSSLLSPTIVRQSRILQGTLSPRAVTYS